MRVRGGQTNGTRSTVPHAEMVMKPLIIIVILRYVGCSHLVTPVFTNDIRKTGHISSSLYFKRTQIDSSVFLCY
jgi:hypothetical protein